MSAGFDGRGDAIARAVAQTIGELPIGWRGHIDSVSVPRLLADPKASDMQIARLVTRALAREIAAAGKREGTR
jgi:hypothetical protein